MRVWMKTILVSILLASTLFLAGYMNEAVAEQKTSDYAGELKLLKDIITYVRYLYVTEPDAQELVHGAIYGMLNKLDPHTVFMTGEESKRLKALTAGKFGGIGFEVDLTPEDNIITVVTPLEGTPAERGGLRARDKILKIDGKSTEGMTLNDAISQMRGEVGTKVTLTIRHHGESNTRDLTFTREVINTQTVRNVYMLNDHVGYIRITDWAESTTADLSTAIANLDKQGMTRLIIDIRSNTGGLLTSATSSLNLFLEGRKLLVYTQGRSKEKMRMDYFSDGTGRYTKLPFVVLVDGASASASEIFAGALRDHGRAKIMGIKTYGKASVQNIFEMQEPGAEAAPPALKLTIAHYYTPKGNDIHGVGIQPDIELALVKYPIIIDKLFFDDMYRRFSEYLCDKVKAKSLTELPSDDAMISDLKQYIRDQKFHFYPEQYEDTLPNAGMEFVDAQLDKNKADIMKIMRREFVRILSGEEASYKYWREQDPWMAAAIKELG